MQPVEPSHEMLTESKVEVNILGTRVRDLVSNTVTRVR